MPEINRVQDWIENSIEDILTAEEIEKLLAFFAVFILLHYVEENFAAISSESIR